VRTSPMNPDTVAPPVGNYSHAVRVDLHDGVLLFVSGQVAMDRQGNLVGAGDMARQTEQVFENLNAILRANGGTFADVVQISTFLTDMTQLQAVRDVRTRYVPDPPPASTTVQVAGLFRPDALIEVEVVAAIPGTTREGG
jgi:2-iminobutanoate/2-iminopropanoate deaminase